MPMNILQRVDGETFGLKSCDCLDSSTGTGQGRNRRNGVIEGSAPNVAIVVGGLTPDRGVNRQLDPSRAN